MKCHVCSYRPYLDEIQLTFWNKSNPVLDGFLKQNYAEFPKWLLTDEDVLGNEENYSTIQWSGLESILNSVLYGFMQDK